MKSVCKAFVIVAEEYVQSFCYCVCKAFVIVENEECVQSFCYVAYEDCVQSFCNCGE